MTGLRRRVLLVVAAAGIVWLAWWGGNRGPAGKPPAASPHSRSEVAQAPPAKAGAEEDFAAEDAADRARIQRDWSDLLEWLRSSPPPSSEEIAARLEKLRADWVGLDPQVLAETLGELLKTGEDAATGLPFTVGLHGALAGWPTLRVFLLDVLAVADPEAAANVARTVMDGTASADEFAVALRPLTRAGQGRATNDELLARFDSLLNHAGWSSQAGFAEAFDIARLVGSAEAARRIAAWQGEPALKAMALHEFAADHPAAIPEILASPEGESLDDTTRASLMARLDPADPTQLAAADAWLHDVNVTPAEAGAFLEVFPLRSATTGHRLYGNDPAPYTREGVAAGDRAALDRVNQWLADPALAAYRDTLGSLQQRLQSWVGQAESR